MTILVSVFGFAGRFAGDLLTSALGWASSLLFGRVQRSHQVFLVLMMASSFLWLVLLLALVLPIVSSTLLAATPHPPFVDQAWLAAVLLLGVILVPLGVGLAGYLVPSQGERPQGAAILVEIARGYLLAPLIGGLLIFLAGVGIARKVRSKRHGWADVHVPIVVKPGGYDRMVADLRDALVDVGFEATAEDAPWVLTLPAQLLTRVAGSNVRQLRPDRLITLSAPDLNVGVYPSDIAISGAAAQRTRARAAILSRLTWTAAHLTMSAEGQEIEDQLAHLGTAGNAAGGRLGADARARFAAIDERLMALAVPTDEWDILFRLRLQVERDLLAGSGSGSVAAGVEPGPDVVAAAASSTRGTARSDARRPGGVRADPLAAPVAGSRR
jgi:hypothetical protein